MNNNTVINRYKGKKFSVLGDSISTLEGYNPLGNKVFYDSEKKLEAGIKAPGDTWWGKVIEYFSGELLINDAWSGCWVGKLPSEETLGNSGCSDKRTSRLHKGEVMPDVIIIYLGTNDWYFGASTECKADIQILRDQSFRYAYDNMLRKLKKNYPHAEIWCCTLSITDYKDESGEFPYIFRGTHMEVYCQVIRQVAREHGCRIIDIYSHKNPYHTIDGFHPSAQGMNTLAETVISEITK